MEDFINIPGGQRPIGQNGKSVNTLFHEPLQPCTDNIESQIKHTGHNGDKQGNRGPFSGQYPVQTLGPEMFPALTWLGDTRGTHLAYKRIAHIRNGSVSVESAFLFHLNRNMFQRFQLVFVKIKLIQKEPVAFYCLACGKAQRNTGFLSMVLDKAFYGVKAAVNGAVMIFDRAEILHKRFFLIFCYMQRMRDQLFNSLLLCR